MKRHIDETLVEGEVILYRARVSIWPFVPLILIGIALLPIAIGIGPLAFAIHRIRSTEVGFTNKRIVAKWGVLSNSMLELNVRKIDTIRVSQSKPGKMLNFGSLAIAGLSYQHAPIPWISNPEEFKRRFEAEFK
jgi:hypothetical protein